MMGYKLAGLLAIATLAITTVTAQAPTQNLVDGSCVTNYNAEYDYFPHKLNTAEDKGQYFSISYHKNYKLVKNDRNGHNYVLVQCGTPTPTDIPTDAIVYQIPVTMAAAMETTVVPYLEMIGAAESLAVVADGSLVSSPCFQKFYNSKQITQLSTTNQTLQQEQLKGIQVQFGINPFDSIASNNSVSSSSAYEPDVLGRSSWISYYAAFYNLESTANSITGAMITNYENLKKAASGYSTKPVVAWALYDAPSQYNENKGTYVINSAPFKAGLTQDAGAVTVQPSSNTFTSSSEFLQALSDVDILIDETYIGPTYDAFLKNYELTEADTDKYKFLKNKAVYRVDGILTLGNGYDWFEAPVAMADALLEDMINAVNSNAPTKDFQRRWLRNIALGESIKYSSEANCTWNTDQPRPNLAVTFQGGDFELSGASPALMKNIGGVISVAIVTLMVIF